MLSDYKVRRLRIDYIAQTALAWRKGVADLLAPSFNIVDFLELTLKPRLQNIDLEIRFFDAAPGSRPAYVLFKRPDDTSRRIVILHMDNEVWELAKLGEPKARFIVAHEIAHIILHDHEAKAFSEDDGSRSTQFEKEEMAEWQADAFALCFLMPARFVLAFDDAQQLSRAASVEYKHALQRFNDVKAESLRFASSYGYACDRCGEFKMSRHGIEMKCECGFSKPLI